ncbi:hypothetical protein [Moorena sp. SIO4G3]|uniref:hypothetical protein n=1 Tax=Moorena sp. SIO4G3 TaxID=2607821 RepID=UPI00142A7C98|nr:hypothetical protein [Moorena sp. SIO4G3]NEO80144.1 hypothetical protein [Moorena sp. SIO4G3]
MCLGVVLAVSMVLLPVNAASADNIENGQSCFGQVRDSKGGDYIGEWQIGNIAGCGEPLTKICQRGEVEGYNRAPAEEGDCCYAKWATGESFIGSVFYDPTYKMYGCESY